MDEDVSVVAHDSCSDGPVVFEPVVFEPAVFEDDAPLGRRENGLLTAPRVRCLA